MPELKHRKTGAVLSVSDETAAKLEHDYEPVASERPRSSNQTSEQ